MNAHATRCRVINQAGHCVYDWPALVGDDVAELESLDDWGDVVPGWTVQLRDIESGWSRTYERCPTGWTLSEES